jgi:hypothetical protein
MNDSTGEGYRSGRIDDPAAKANAVGIAVFGAVDLNRTEEVTGQSSVIST